MGAFPSLLDDSLLKLLILNILCLFFFFSILEYLLFSYGSISFAFLFSYGSAPLMKLLFAKPCLPHLPHTPPSPPEQPFCDDIPLLSFYLKQS